ncbi:Uncharacterised protein [Sphingobacterium multivorum]|uniref:Uncharacterized protein n=1 Tax=Sphingobacterium multivorum TaxID=28454 RepID=A0A2X2IRP1_SPHMU|nr:hypothetical protein [Sphingobacterium multivorum]SPZ84942.1 Uncharacterised protein [Sphingobacterium multivorum]
MEHGRVAKGWTSTINTTEGGGNYASIYARPGFIKLGRTNYGGDLISPKLANVQRTKIYWLPSKLYDMPLVIIIYSTLVSKDRERSA